MRLTSPAFFAASASLVALSACGGPSLSFDCGVGTRPCGNKGLYDYDGDGYCEDVDCNEDACDINPGSAETCDGTDNDCDGFTDGMDKQLVYDKKSEETFEYYVDYDGDGQCSHDKIRMCANYAYYSAESETDNPLYTAENGDSFYLCDRTGTAGQIDDIVESDTSGQAQYTIFDCCDVEGDDGCIEGVKPECVASDRDADGGGECINVC